MKKTLRLVGVAAMVLLLAASCKKEEKNNGEKQMMTFSAGIEQTGAKTGLLSNGDHAFKQVWTPNDAINVNGTSLTVSINPEDNAKGTFTGEVIATGKYYAVYPSTATLNGSTATFTLPASLDYVAGSYESNLAPMADYTENNELNFKNLCGLMELGLVGENITVTSLELSCDKPICGQTSAYTIGGDADLEMAEGAGETITLNCVTTACPNGVALNGTTPTSFIFVLPPVTEGDFTLTVTYSGGTQTITLPENISIGAGKVAYNNTPYKIEAGSSAPEGFVDFGTHVGGVSTGKPLYWAECNLGAAKPEEYGDYYAFGHTYKYAMNGSGHGYEISYYNDTYAFGFYDGGGCDLRRYNDCDGLRELLPEDDCVWQANKTHNDANPTEVIRMPSLAEFDELFTKAYFEWTTGYKDTGVAGVIIYAVRDSSHAGQFGTQTGSYSTTSDKHIFIPAAGFGQTGTNYISGQTQILNVWLKTIANYGTGKPYGLSIYITSSGIAAHSTLGYPHNFVNTRIRPCSIRPVRQGK